MSDRVRIILAVETSMPEAIRRDVDQSLKLAGWKAAREDQTCWVCKTLPNEIEDYERQVRKALEFAAFTAGASGRLSFALKIGDDSPRVCAVRVGSGGLKTKNVIERGRGLEFATEKVPNGGASNIPSATNMPGNTQLQTAF